MKPRDWLLLGGAGLAAWWLYKKFAVVGTALTSAGEKAGGAVFDALNSDAGGESIFYKVHFSNGDFMIPGSSVDKSGLFMFRGVQFKMLTDPTTGAHMAVTPTYGGIFS